MRGASSVLPLKFPLASAGLSLVLFGNPCDMKKDSSEQTRPPGPPPVGSLTLLLADVAGSTRLWTEHPGVMSVVMERHHALARFVIERHGGYRPPDQGEGDSTFAVFTYVADAVACALEFQRAVLNEGWPAGIKLLVRIALHSGDLELRSDGLNYYGLAISRCARLAAAAHGGQTLVSESTATLLAGHLPRNAGLRDLDLHRFKDLLIPERVFQLTHPDLPPNFPRIHSLDARKHNLPVQLTRFIGREREMSNLKDHLDTNRLLTLSGTGGCGKTRLSIAGRWRCGGPLPRWRAELARDGGRHRSGADSTRSDSVLAIRQQLARPSSPRSSTPLVAETCLLLLDNCEHIAAAAAGLVAAVLAACPEVAVLATSREPLGVARGHGNMAGPGPLHTRRAGLGDCRECAGVEAVQLFVDRAVRRSGIVADRRKHTDRYRRDLPTRLTASRLPWNWRPRAFRPSTVEEISALDHRFRLLMEEAGRSLPTIERCARQSTGATTC